VVFWAVVENGVVVRRSNSDFSSSIVAYLFAVNLDEIVERSMGVSILFV
jgi:hypothetical protein